MQERSKFGCLGWNESYNFLYSDYSDSLEQLKNFGKRFPSIPWDAVRYYVGETNYGGSIYDWFDRRRMMVLFNDMLSEEAMKDDYKLFANKAYNTPVDIITKEQYIKHAKGLPQIDDPELFGLNKAAQITCSFKFTEQILNSLSLLISTTLKVEGEEESKIIKLLEEIPEEFDIDECIKKFPYKSKEAQNIVLIQELRKYNNLLSIIRKSLSEIKAMKEGEAPLTDEMELTVKSLLKNKIPKLWQANSYPSIKSATTWIKDLQQRINFFRKWINEGNVNSYWISAFFLPQSLLTAILRNHAQQNQIPIDSLVLDYKILKEEEKGLYAGNKIHGLFIEGAKWNAENGCLEEAVEKMKYLSVPEILVKPSVGIEETQETYKCPVYSTESRQEQITSTGSTKALIMTINLPISPNDTVKHWIRRGVVMIAQLND